MADKPPTLKRTPVLGTLEETTRKAFKCTCNASARFVPVYRFTNDDGRPQIMMGALHPPSIKCANCNQMYVWRDGGWFRESTLDDLITFEAAGG